MHLKPQWAPQCHGLCVCTMPIAHQLNLKCNNGPSGIKCMYISCFYGSYADQLLAAGAHTHLLQIDAHVRGQSRNQRNVPLFYISFCLSYLYFVFSIYTRIWLRLKAQSAHKCYGLHMRLHNARLPSPKGFPTDRRRLLKAQVCPPPLIQNFFAFKWTSIS